jgi:hypothetical protein
VDIILVGYRAADTVSAIDFCERTFGGPFAGRRVLVLNHPQLREPVAPYAMRWELMFGSNDLSEFSGWQEGLAATSSSQPTDTLFVNDTVIRHRRFSAARRGALKSAIRGAKTASFIGFTDRIGGDLSVAGLPLDAWISTYCFAFTHDALRRLGGRLYESSQVAKCVPGGLVEANFFAELSPVLEEHLRRWMFVGGWHSAAPLNAMNVGQLERKARTIIAELLLAARCRLAGIDLIDPFREHFLAHQADRLLRRLFGFFDPMARRGV